MSAAFDRSELQGNIVRGYARQRVHHLLLTVADRAAAGAWLADTVGGDPARAPQVTTDRHWGPAKPESCFNLALTASGLQALGVHGDSLGSFPIEFREGAAARAVKLGDIGDSAPARWAAPFDKPERLHLVVSVHADSAGPLQAVQQRVLAAGGGRAFQLAGVLEAANFDGDMVHFGYRDNISQPRFEHVHDPALTADEQPLAPLGTVLLGHDTAFEGLRWRVPAPSVLGHNGSFSALRVLQQDVAGFEDYLSEAATVLLAHPHANQLLLPPEDDAPPGPVWWQQAGLTPHAALREVVAAKMCGRWRNGLPLARYPWSPAAPPGETPQLSKFSYRDDEDGVRCPYGSHTRRCNPRSGTIVQRMASHTRRLVRRGMPYGPAYDPARPHDGVERGLVGNFLCASLIAQFEALQYDWLNLGLQDPRITGSNDPLLGANDPGDSWFEIPLRAGPPVRLRGLPRFVRTRGSAYLFLPSVPAIRHLAACAR